jgi:hypothetical protein
MPIAPVTNGIAAGTTAPHAESSTNTNQSMSISPTISNAAAQHAAGEIDERELATRSLLMMHLSCSPPRMWAPGGTPQGFAKDVASLSLAEEG